MNGTVLVSTHRLPAAGELRDAFRKAGYRVDLVTPDEALSEAGEPVLLVLTTSPARGEALVRQARDRLDVPVFAVLGGENGSVHAAPQDPAVREVFGAETSPDEVVLLARRLLDRRRLQRETGIVGESEPIREALERVVQIAPVASTVLITGESGTGKELVARGIHALSPRRHKPFIAVNVAALSDTLLESELFGHEKGAFTGAVDSRRGLFELAHGGTIFLDEIGEMPLATQTKLLRVLEQREFLRVGGEVPIKVDVRIIAATNQDLRQLVAVREFRRDLYYRLNVLSIHLPPLRERPEDIPLLVRGFVEEASQRLGRPFPGISADAMELLVRHRWPGNVRELRNLVESMVVMSPGREIRPSDIPDEVRGLQRSLLPVPIPRPPERQGGESSLRPELEFVFRTLVELRVDLDDLRREFDAYQERSDELPGRLELRLPPPREAPEPAAAPPEEPSVEEEAEEEGVVVYRPGMTMEEMERQAIVAALAEVEGNRRRAAERLGIGERTLYRKIKRYGLEG